MLSQLVLYADGNISGKITDSSSATPIENIKVMLLGSFPQETRTDAKGNYQFLNVPSGKYEVQVEPPFGYAGASKNPLPVNVVSSDIKAHFSLGIPGNIKGRIIDANTNLPIANANIDVMRGTNIIASAMTDDNGMYIISKLTPQPYIIRVRAPYFQSSLQLGIPLANETVTIDFALEYPPGSITGKIIDVSTGQPIDNVTIDILENGIIVESVQSNEDGSYILSEVTPANYQMRIAMNGFQTITQDISLLTNEIITVDFTLKAFGRVTGKVIHAFTGEPIVRACVGMWQNDAVFSYTHTDKNGNFSLKGLGNHQLVVQFPKFHDLEKEIDIPPIQTVTLNFSLVCFEPHPPSRIVGQVIYKRFAHQLNRIHRLQWTPSPSNESVVSYRIYREQKLIAEIAANDRLVYHDQWRSEKAKTYQITAINVFGQESESLSVILK